MLNAAEAAMDQVAEDDGERARNRAKLYAPPKGYRPPGGRRQRPAGTGMNMAQAMALTAQLSTQDAQIGRQRT
ncbi:hypothetical protein ACFPN0_15325 [Kitasatospora cinereorecta]